MAPVLKRHPTIFGEIRAITFTMRTCLMCVVTLRRRRRSARRTAAPAVQASPLSAACNRIVDHITSGWAPEQIADRLRLEKAHPWAWQETICRDI
ncbi:hypothetical protein QCN27_09630 [Cereibacter sp. SYSU M97828]|nr:hypothetical protein [Cereibacter flavus]